MPTLTVTKNYADGTDLTEAQLDSAFESIETFLNTTKLDSSNLQSNAVVEAAITNGSCTADKLASNSVTTAKIADGQVTGAKLEATVADNSTLTYDAANKNIKIKDAGITNAKMGSLSVGTAQLIAGCVTPAKRAALGQQICSAFTDSTSSSSFSDVTGATVTITTTGRPVFVGVTPASSTSVASITVNNNSTETGMVVEIQRGSTTIATTGVSMSCAVNGSGYTQIYAPPCFFQIDTPNAGTYTYKVRIKKTNGDAGISNCRLVAFEL